MDKDIEAKVRELAQEAYDNGLNCSEAVFDALAKAGVLELPPGVRAMASGFGGGIGMCGHTCGALSSAIMANGYLYGRADPYATPPDKRRGELAGRYYRRFNRLVNDFSAAHGGVLCRDIVNRAGGWYSDERRQVCARLVVDTAALAYRYLCIPQEEAFVMPYGENMAGRV